MVGAIFTALLGWIMLGKDFHGNTIMPMVGWRTFTGVCSIPAIISLLLARRVLPESAKFLLQKQRYVDAVSVRMCVVESFYDVAVYRLRY